VKLNQKVVLVTGASSGIGRAVALELGRGGNRVVITARRKELLEEVAAAIRTAGGEAMPVAGDALEEQQAKEGVQKIVDRFGRIDVALLNVGAGPPLNIATATRREILGNMRVNYDTMINWFVPLVDRMKRQKEGGVIAHTNSLAGFLGLPMQGQYCAAKAACRLFLDTARMELKPCGIRILTLCPGFVITEKNREDGIPKPFSMTEEQAARHILKALEQEISEYLFPPSLKTGILLARVLPRFLVERLLMKIVPAEY